MGATTQPSRTLLSGATGPVGRGIAQVLDRHGHRLALQFRSNGAAAAELLASLDPERGHVLARADLAEAGAASALVGVAEEGLDGPLTGVVHAAWPPTPSLVVADTDPSTVDASLVGYRMWAALAAAASPSLRATRGACVLVGAASSTRIHPGLGLYGAAKAAATVLARVLALEEGRHGVRVNVVSPGRVAVGSGDLAESDPVFASLDEITRLRRPLPLPTAGEVGELVAWLLGPGSAGVTGQVLSIAGGEPV